MNKVKVPLRVTIRGFVNIERPEGSKELEERVHQHIQMSGIDELNTTLCLDVEIDWNELLPKP